METIEEIVEAMRGRGEDYRVDRELWKKYADRIEAAVIRENRTCKDSLQVGDIAAMRGALENARSLISEGIETEVKDDIRHPFHLELAIEKINEALSTPPRNCDLFGGDPKMLYTAWFDWTASPSGMNDDGTVKLTYGEWLLVRAKGGAYANR
jgi:DNA-binding FrmR family transcriptional regulator